MIWPTPKATARPRRCCRRSLERCQSGRMGRSRKPVFAQADREFESLPLRCFCSLVRERFEGSRDQNYRRRDEQERRPSLGAAAGRPEASQRRAEGAESLLLRCSFLPFLTVADRFFPSTGQKVIATMERCPSGRRKTTGNRLAAQKVAPGFESLPLRHFCSTELISTQRARKREEAWLLPGRCSLVVL